MPSTGLKDAVLRLAVLLFFYQSATSLIIPEELPTILSLIYSNIPPIKKGTDSRLGVGFRLGEHADFQVLVELGPQTETDPIATTDAKRRRDAMFTAAMKGELGPLAQAVARYQLERKLQQELERLKGTEVKTKKSSSTDEKENQKTEASEWLSKWSQGPLEMSEEKKILYKKAEEVMQNENIQRRIGQSVRPQSHRDKILELTKLYNVETDNKNTSVTTKE